MPNHGNGQANNGNEQSADKALPRVEELFKTVITTSGVMLALLWGLTQKEISPPVLGLIQLGSFALVLSIGTALLGMQFIVAQLQKEPQEAQKDPKPMISKHVTVATCYLIAWLSFLAGCTGVILAIFLL
jgi:hypothetical protein